MTKFKFMLFVLFSVLLFTSIGCSMQGSEGAENGEDKIPGQEDIGNEEENTAASQELMDEFDAQISENVSLLELIHFIDQNIQLTTKEDASEIVAMLEEKQKGYLTQLEDKYFANEDAIQLKIRDEQKAVLGDNPKNEIQNEELKELIVETIDSGYKLTMAEGSVFPIIDYNFYEKYSSHLTVDLQNYIEIMTVESNQVPIKDAALVISWDEIIKRALTQEEFITQYPESRKIDEINYLYSRYLVFILYGSNNTPVFDYDSERLKPEVKESYQKAISTHGNEDSDVNKFISEFLNILEKSDDQLSDEAEQFRQEHAMDKFLEYIKSDFK